MKTFLAIILTALLSLSLSAQTAPSPGAKQPDVKSKPAEKTPTAPAANTQAKPASAQPAKPKPDAAGPPQPAPEMERLLKQLGGRWNTEEKHEPSAMLPNGGTGKGQEGIRPGPGRLSLIGEYTSQGPMGEFSGIGIINWVPAENAYKIHWFDNTMAGVTVMTGKWQGNDLVFTGSEMMEGKRMYSRHAFTELKPESFTYTIDMGPAADQVKRAVTIKYTKVDMQRMMMERMERLSGPRKP